MLNISISRKKSRKNVISLWIFFSVISIKYYIAMYLKICCLFFFIYHEKGDNLFEVVRFLTIIGLRVFSLLSKAYFRAALLIA